MTSWKVTVFKSFVVHVFIKSLSGKKKKKEEEEEEEEEEEGGRRRRRRGGGGGGRRRRSRSFDNLSVNSSGCGQY
jgi:hypothetical protein